jgi:peroxiredoxin
MNIRPIEILPMTAIVFGMVLPWFLVAMGLWIGHQLVSQSGRILLRLESIEIRLGSGRTAPAKPPVPKGLKIGTLAPDFELPDLGGTLHKLSEFRGRDVLLVFFNPKCGFCTKMAADLAGLPLDTGDGRAMPLLVTTGDADENRRFMVQHGIRCFVLLQQEMVVASQFRATGTPMGYRIDSSGRISSPLLVGADALLKLAATSGLAPADKNVDGATSHGKGDPSLTRSRLNRDGLKAGAMAPDFRLPRLEGHELSLADLRGERVLLVFSDPDCGPCMELAPQLEKIHQQRGDLQVVMVSRRDVEANRAKASKLGLTFPIVLQRQWEISLKYALFATPIGYLIDEQGVIAKDVAIGVQPILALVDKPVPAPAGVATALSRKEPAWTT